MPLVTMKELLADAERGGYAVGGFTVYNLEFCRAVMEAAEAERSPVLFMFGPVEAKFVAIERIAAIALREAQQARVPVGLHLDHGDGLPLVVAAIRSGFTSVMLDASHLPYAQNAAQTRQVVEIARTVGVTVEGEIGRIGGFEFHAGVADAEALTDPAEAESFARETGVDALAVAIGTVHGYYKTKPKLDLPRLERIRERVKLPIVLHGGSDTPPDLIRAAVQRGVRKININTELRAAFMSGLRTWLAANPTSIDPMAPLQSAMSSLRDLVAAKLRLFGSSGKA